MEFSEELKKERIKRGWSQQHVADAVGCHVQTVARWENGRAVPWPLKRPGLCALFGWDPAIFGWGPEEVRVPDAPSSSEESYELWEYRVVKPSGNSVEEEDHFNSLGADGWEAVCSFSATTDCSILFKRPRKSAAPGAREDNEVADVALPPSSGNLSGES